MGVDNILITSGARPFTWHTVEIAWDASQLLTKLGFVVFSSLVTGRGRKRNHFVIYCYIGLANSFVLEPSDTTAMIGQNVVMDCVAPRSVPPAVVSWSRDFAQLDSPRYQVLQNGSLVISEVELRDAVTYHCTATNSLSAATRTSRGAALTAIGRAAVLLGRNNSSEIIF